jgi:Tfp pilus assembly protein PilF
LPRLFGGDTAKGEAILKRVIDDDPMAFSARITLATVFADRGDRASAIAYAQRALEIAQQQGRADKIARAEETLAELHAGVASR